MTCADCSHWHRIANPVVTAPQQGQCRGAPPQLLVLGMSHQGPMIASDYPVTAAELPQCGLFRQAKRLVVPTLNGEDDAS